MYHKVECPAKLIKLCSFQYKQKLINVMFCIFILLNAKYIEDCVSVMVDDIHLLTLHFSLNSRTQIIV